MKEIGDLSKLGDTVQPDMSNLPLGLPEFLWWALAIFAITYVIGMMRGRFKWLYDRTREPSTYLGTAIFLACGGLFANSLTMDPLPFAQGMLLASTLFAFLGTIGKEKEGPLL